MMLQTTINVCLRHRFQKSLFLPFHDVNTETKGQNTEKKLCFEKYLCKSGQSLTDVSVVVHRQGWCEVHRFVKHMIV